MIPAQGWYLMTLSGVCSPLSLIMIVCLTTCRAACENYSLPLFLSNVFFYSSPLSDNLPTVELQQDSPRLEDYFREEWLEIPAPDTEDEDVACERLVPTLSMIILSGISPQLSSLLIV